MPGVFFEWELRAPKDYVLYGSSRTGGFDSCGAMQELEQWDGGQVGDRAGGDKSFEPRLF
jgi:hypothetical protein